MADGSDGRLNVLIVAPVPIYGDALAAALHSVHGLNVVGTTHHPVDAIEALAFRPQVAAIDARMPDSIRIVRALAGADVKVVVFNLNESEAEVVSYAESGAVGFVAPAAAVTDLARAITRAAEGELLCSQRTAAALCRRLAERAGSHDHDVMLTHREREVLTLIREGLSNKDIAHRLHIEIPTVKNHVHNLLDKLHVRSRTAAATATIVR